MAGSVIGALIELAIFVWDLIKGELGDSTTDEDILKMIQEKRSKMTKLVNDAKEKEKKIISGS